MKKTYIAPAVCAATFKTAVLMEASKDVKPGTTVSGGSGGWTRQMWAEEEEN